MTQNQVNKALSEFEQKTPKSKQFFNKAKRFMPGGVTANIKYYAPYPVVMKKAKGSYLYDVDGNEYVDYLLSYGALILGHGHPEVAKAIHSQLGDLGTYLLGTPHELEVEMAQKIQRFYPSMESIRYTNSGTEATLLAIRTAYAFTGKHKIAKFEGHYHGGYDQLLFSINPAVQKAGPAQQPIPVAESKGIDSYHQDHTIILPFNDIDATADILRKNKEDLAAVIMEPIQGGFIPAEKKFIDELRKITKELGVLLIFDEVKTGFRIGLGGAQEYYGIHPDLTALGKAIGGGFPIGILGGKAEIMKVSSPSAKADVFDGSQSSLSSADNVLFHSGTYNGHPTILAAGLATVKVLEQELPQVVSMTTMLKEGITELFINQGIGVHTIGLGTIFNVVISDMEKIKNYRDYQQSNFMMRKALDFYLLNEGVYTKPLNRYSLATAHTKKEIDRTLDAYDRVLAKMKK
ncbi:aspartate aminotransferase family protein [Bacillus sp. B15-48]|uniref:aspartate aminotransferase family protein n=1 Tax=Bacillus sp. B15-48 TaxID=1548601 RepID=UPI00193F62D2|nr:aspartate aminotransferase family protein [Bacillus sp. B15-48]MBM4763168.1 aminotransferase class III-fold pyridoxal phosphate-dependent enzyme [Bacillus sp. B15-48]